MRATQAIALTVGLAACVWSSDALARPTARLVYVTDDPSACPNEQQVSAAVSERLGYVPFQAGATRVVTLMVKRRGAGWFGTVEAIEDASVRGRRELTSDSRSCADLVSSLALSVALLLEPDGKIAEREAPAPPASRASNHAAPAPAPQIVDPRDDPFANGASTPAEPRGPEPHRAHRAVWAFGLIAAGSLGSEPRLAPAGGLFGDVRFEGWRLGIDARADVPTSSEPVGGVGVRVWLAQGTLVPCLVRGFTAVCALASMGALSASGEGALARPRREHAAYVALGGRFEATLPLSMGPIALRAYGDLVVPLTQPTFAIAAVPLWTVPSLAGAVGVRVALELR